MKKSVALSGVLANEVACQILQRDDSTADAQADIRRRVACKES